MEENENHTMLAFEAPKELPTFIKVIGVGGGGGNAVNHMFRQGIQGVDFIVCNTDSQALQSSPVPKKIALGKGLGAGSKPERAKEAVKEKEDEIREVLSQNTQMLFITAGMGGGTGTGAAPVIAEIAKSIELKDADTERILVVAIVTMPFTFEGRRRREQAARGIEELRKYVDSILVINNDKLRAFGDMTINAAFSKADDVLLTAAKGIAEMITVTSYVNVDFQDVNTVMEKSGTALMGTGIGKGENRAMEAIKDASTSVLLNDDNIQGARYVLLYFSCNPEHMMRMDEVDTVTTYLTEIVGPDSEEVIWGMGASDDLDDEVKITLIATGFEKKDHIEPPISNTPINKSIPDIPQTHTVTPPEIPFVVQQAQEPAAPVSEPTSVSSETYSRVTSQPAQPQHRSLYDDDDCKYTANDKYEDSSTKSEQPIGVTPEGGRIFRLTPSEMESDVAVADHHEEPENDPYSQGIHVVQHDQTNTGVPETPHASVQEQPQPIVSAPAPQQTMSTYQSTPMEEPTKLSEKNTMNRAERIKYMHDLLKNNPNGPALVSQMRPAYSDDAYSSCSSSVSDAANTIVDAAGNIIANNSFLFNQPD